MNAVLTNEELQNVYSIVNAETFNVNDIVNAEQLEPNQTLQIILFSKIAKHVNSAEELQEIIEQGNIPPLKLSPEEMESLKGGFAPLAIFAARVLIRVAASSIVNKCY